MLALAPELHRLLKGPVLWPAVQVSGQSTGHCLSSLPPRLGRRLRHVAFVSISRAGAVGTATWCPCSLPQQSIVCQTMVTLGRSVPRAHSRLLMAVPLFGTFQLLLGTFQKNTLPQFMHSKRIELMPPFPNHVTVTRCTVLCFSDAAVPMSPPVPLLLGVPPFPGPPTLPRCRNFTSCDPTSAAEGVLFLVGVESRRTREVRGGPAPAHPASAQ